MTGTSGYCFEYNLHLIKIPSHLNRESIYTQTVQGTDFGCQKLYLGPVLVPRFGLGVLGRLFARGDHFWWPKSVRETTFGRTDILAWQSYIHATTLTHYKYLCALGVQRNSFTSSFNLALRSPSRSSRSILDTSSDLVDLTCKQLGHVTKVNKLRSGGVTEKYGWSRWVQTLVSYPY